MNFYSQVKPIETRIPADRQRAKRHYGVHPYFTRRPYNVVREYVLRFSKEGDIVLDPFGGSGVTAIEALLENRLGIHNDINPLANFIATGIADLRFGSLEEYESALQFLKQECEHTLNKMHGMSEAELLEFKTISPNLFQFPENVPLPRTSDVKRYFDLFTLKQLGSLALLRKAIESIDSKLARRAMLLAWSATLAKLNKTFLSAEGRAESRGGSSVFSIYRYKVAKEPVELAPWETFFDRATNVLKAKAEIDQTIRLKKQTGGWHGGFQSYSEDVEQLACRLDNSVDYIFTDPPYGGHISYLDLSTIWNTWLGLTPSLSQRQSELIVGGELSLPEKEYVERLGRSVKACIKMLKRERWLSIVFQHWNISYFEAILNSAAEAGAELKAAISQVGDPVWSMHKKKNSSVLSGEMILTFQKNGVVRKTSHRGRFDISDALTQVLGEFRDEEVLGEYLFNRIVIEAWKKSAIHTLTFSRGEFLQLLSDAGLKYDQLSHKWVRDASQSQLSLSFSK